METSASVGGGDIALVETKLSAPTLPADLVPRSRLNTALDAAVADPVVRVVLVSAPAGSGKSTAAAAWQQHRDDCAWLQVDTADRDAARFWGHVIASLSQVTPTPDEALSSLATQAAADTGPLIDALANALAAAPPITLVIDDYHLVTGPAIDDAIERLVQLAPQTFTLVLLTRWDPSIRLSRLRVARTLVELRATELRFLEDEAASLLGYDTLETDDLVDHIRALCDRTEGWAAGLVLARLSLAATEDETAFIETFSGDDRLVVDYLTDEFFAHTGPDELRRLLATSVLDEMSGSLVDAVCATDDGSSWLADLASRNQLVISLDRSREWFRYHHLMRDVLRLRAEASQPLDDYHRRAGTWHRAHGDLDRAAEHLLAAGDLDEAADVVAEHSMELLNLGQIETVSGYLARLGTTVDTHLRCSCIDGWIYAVRGRVDDASRCLERTRALEATQPSDPFASGLIAGLDVLLRLGNGEVGRAIDAAADAPAISDATQTMMLGQAFMWGGRFDEAEPLLVRAWALAEANHDRFALAGTPAIRAVMALEQERRGAARREAETTIEVIATRGAPSGTHGALANAVLARTEDDPAAARHAARAAEGLASISALPLAAAYAFTSAGDVLCAHGESDGIDLVRQGRAIVDRLADPGLVGRYLARVEARHQLAAAPAGPSALPEELTDRELAVLRYLPSSMSQRDIANELFVSLNTVKTHCRAIYRKLAVGDRKSAVQAARDADLL